MYILSFDINLMKINEYRNDNSQEIDNEKMIIMAAMATTTSIMKKSITRDSNNCNPNMGGESNKRFSSKNNLKPSLCWVSDNI